MSLPNTYSDPVNFFTCKTTNGGNPEMWLEGYTSGSPGKIVGWNDDFPKDSLLDYSWIPNARIISPLPNGGAVWVGASSTNNPSFTTDVYAGLSDVQGPTFNNFPELLKKHSFMSGIVDTMYNCIAWSVGITSSKPYYTSLKDYDVFYKGYGYIPCFGADTINAAIALWAYVINIVDTIFWHASVTKNTVNSNPHGFEWESKIGVYYERIMHTRYALWSDDYTYPVHYGTIIRYYKPDPGRAGNEIIPAAESTFSSSDLNRIAFLKDLIPDLVKTGFDAKYLAWKNTWRRPELAFYSNPRTYSESEEYESLLRYCEKYGKALWPLIFEKLSQEDPFVSNMLEDLTFVENRYLYEKIKSTARDDVKAGKPFLTSHSIYIEYSKKLLEKEYPNILKSIDDISVKEKANFEINISANSQEIILNLYSTKNEKAFIKLYNVFGELELEEDYNIYRGNQTIVINASSFKKGIYIVKISIGDESLSQTISIN